MFFGRCLGYAPARLVWRHEPRLVRGLAGPEALEDYDIHHLVGDLVGVLDDLDVSQAVVVGHDWGSMVSSHLALLHPERMRGLVNMSVPHISRGGTAPMTALRNAVGDMFFYMLYFQEPGVADA